MTVNQNSEFLFLYEAILTNPNGDPDQENKPRMDGETKTLLVSDVRRKRDVRDFLSNKGYEIFVNQLDDKKVTMDMMFEAIKTKHNSGDEAAEDIILKHCIDIRMFGSAMAVKGGVRTFTGPIQLSWGYSLHPVDMVKSNSIVTIMNDGNSNFGNMYKIHYALIAQSGSMNKYNAVKTKMTEEDRDIFRTSLVQSMMNNLTHSKQGQIPSLYLEVVYQEDFDGYLGDLRRYIDVEQKKETAIRDMDDLELDFSRLSDVIKRLSEKEYIKEVLIWKNDMITDSHMKNLPTAAEIDLWKPVQSK